MIDNKMDVAAWKRDLFDVIESIADEYTKNRQFLELDGEISSLGEEAAYIYNTYDIDGFLNLEVDQSGLTAKQYEALKLFRNVSREFFDKLNWPDTDSMDPVNIASMPGWKAITAAAKEFCRSLGGHAP